MMTMRSTLRAIGLCMLLTTGATGASAQVPNINLMPETKSRTPEEIERDERADKAYRESLRKIPDAGATDPWGNVRSAAKPAVSAKPTQPKRGKSDATAN